MAQLRHLAHSHHFLPMPVHIGEGWVDGAVGSHRDFPPLRRIAPIIPLPIQRRRQPRKRCAKHPFICHAVAAVLHGTSDDISHHGIDQCRNLHDPAVLHFGKLRVFFHQLLPGILLLRPERADFVNQAADLTVPVSVRKADLTEHYRAKILLPHHDRYRHVHDPAVTEIDEGLVTAHSLQPGQGIAAVAALAGDWILSNHRAESSAPAVL